MPVTDAVETTTAYYPTREPVFTQTGQIGIVVRDLDATLRRFAEEFGIGPWQIWEVTPENAPDLRHDGEPLDEHGIFARFLAERGEGVHHIAVVTSDFRGTVAEQLRRGVALPLSGAFAGVEVAYLPTDRSLGVLLEVFSAMAQDTQEPGSPEDA